MRLLAVEGHWRVRRDMPGPRPLDIEAGLVLETPRRWLRLFAVWGDAPGSHMIGRHWTVWPTRIEDMRGWNLRVGWWPGPCLTVLAHTRPARDTWAQAAAEDTAAQVVMPRAHVESAAAYSSWTSRMATYGPCETCGAARAVRPRVSYGIPGVPGSAGVYDQLYCPACGWPGPGR